MSAKSSYRGRLAPTPSGSLHIGHALTFARAWERARQAGGALVLRVEDLDAPRCRPEFVSGIIEDLRWLGIDWDEGPDCGGPFAPYEQSRRLPLYLDAWRRLNAAGHIYPSAHSRRDVERALSAPHEGEEGPVFPAQLRPESFERVEEPGAVNWRIRLPYGRVVRFRDALAGDCEFVAGRDFGDFLVWRKDGWPSYELAVVADDAAMGVSEVVRGADLLLSTARQILLYEALGWAPPLFCHCPLVRDAQGRRLAKRAAGLSIAELRARGLSAGELLAMATQWHG